MKHDDDALQQSLAETFSVQGIDPDTPCHETIRPTLSDTAAMLGTLASDMGRPDGLRDVEPEVEPGAELARGGMGRVKLATQKNLGREVVVKTLLPHMRSPRAMAAMLREARLSARLAHPNTVPIYTLGWSEDEGPVIVMQRVHGRDWRSCFSELSLVRNIEVLLDVMNGVEFAHAQGIIHRDIKPENVMLGAFGEVYLMDWGVATTLPAPEEAGMLLGTPAYMAPEMVDEGTVDERSDIYLLGSTLHEVLTGELRHQGEGVFSVLTCAIRSEPIDYGDALPEELAAIINRACHRDPEARFQSVSEMRDALTRFLDHRGSVQASDAALESLEVLRGLERVEGDSPHVLQLRRHRVYSAARTGFEQALREWPENQEARQGLEAAIEVMIGYELEAQNIQSVGLLLAELGDERPELEARLAALKAELAKAEAAREELEELKGEMRFQGQDWGRSLLTLGNGVIVLAALWIPAFMQRAGHLTITVENSLYYLVACGLVMIAGILPFKRFLLDSKVYGRVMLLLSTMAPLACLNRVFGLVVDATWAQVVTGDCLLAVALLLSAAITIARAFWLSVFLAVLASFLLVWNIDYAIEIWGATYFLNNLWVAYVVRPGNEIQSPLFQS